MTDGMNKNAIKTEQKVSKAHAWGSCQLITGLSLAGIRLKKSSVCHRRPFLDTSEASRTLQSILLLHQRVSAETC
jgi:hypothetical protein